jgi:hypothetical protein
MKLTSIVTASKLSHMDEFVIHGCEQVLRLTRVKAWDDLSEAVKVQLGFNMGVVALGLKLTKDEGFQALADAREGRVSMEAFRDHLKSVIGSHRVPVDEAKIARPF